MANISWNSNISFDSFITISGDIFFNKVFFCPFSSHCYLIHILQQKCRNCEFFAKTDNKQKFQWTLTLPTGSRSLTYSDPLLPTSTLFLSFSLSLFLSFSLLQDVQQSRVCPDLNWRCGPTYVSADFLLKILSLPCSLPQSFFRWKADEIVFISFSS